MPAFAFMLVHAFAIVATADTAVEVSPATSTSYHLGGTNSQAEAVVWTQGGTTDTTISALIGSVDGNPETVDAYLSYNSQSNLIASTNVTVGSFADSTDFTAATLFSGLTLESGVYLLTLFNTDTTGNVDVRWADGANVTNGLGTYAVSAYSDSPNTDVSTPYNSNFSTATDNLGFTVTGTPVVPEPGSIVLALTSVVVSGGARLARRRAV
jgi:hypothetical protein